MIRFFAALALLSLRPPVVAAAVPAPQECRRLGPLEEHDFHIAVQEGNLSAVKSMLEKGSRINACNVNGISVLQHTVFFKQAAMARFLIANGARPATERERGDIAAMLGESEPPAAVAPPSAAPAPPPAAPPAASGSRLPESPAPSFSAKPRPSDFAVVVGIESYSEIQTKAPYAERDADAVKAHLLALGVPERNIVLLKGPKAVKSSIEKYVGTWLPLMAKPDSRVYFYFSGHGAPSVKSGKAYLVPWDGDPNFLEDTAVPLSRLYAKLGALPSERVLVAMDSCFSGAGGRSVLASGARPLVSRVDTGSAPAKLTVLSASSSSEISGSLDEKGHGAFTYFLLTGLGAGKTTPKELVEYLTPLVQDEARRLNREQTPQLQGDGAWPLR